MIAYIILFELGGRVLYLKAEYLVGNISKSPQDLRRNITNSQPWISLDTIQIGNLFRGNWAVLILVWLVLFLMFVRLDAKFGEHQCGSPCGLYS